MTHYTTTATAMREGRVPWPILLTPALLAGVAIRAEEAPAAADAWRFALRPAFWLADEGHSRLRSMELEGFKKGGSGAGTSFTYDEVGAGGLRLVPELEAEAVRGPHRIRLDVFRSSASDTLTLDRGLEFDGDLRSPGDRVRVEFETWWMSAGYAYRVADADPEVWLGLDVVRWKWSGKIAQIAGTSADPSSDESIGGYELPVPTAGVRWSLSDRVRLDVDAAALYGTTLNRRGTGISGNANGVVRLRGGLAWDAGPVELDAAAGLTMIDAVSFEHRDEADLLNYRLFGLQLGATIRF